MGELRRIAWRSALGLKPVHLYDPLLMAHEEAGRGQSAVTGARRRTLPASARGPHAGTGLGQRYTIELGLGSIMVILGFLAFAVVAMGCTVYLVIGAMIYS